MFSTRNRVRSISAGSASSIDFEIRDDDYYYKKEKFFIFPAKKFNLNIRILRDNKDNISFMVEKTVQEKQRSVEKRYKKRLFYKFNSTESYLYYIGNILKSKKYEQKDSIYTFTDDGFIVLNKQNIKFKKSRKSLSVEGIDITIFDDLLNF